MRIAKKAYFKHSPEPEKNVIELYQPLHEFELYVYRYH